MYECVFVCMCVCVHIHTHRQTYRQTYTHMYLIPAAAAAGVKKGEIGGTGLAVDAIGVGGVEAEPSPPDILPSLGNS